MKTNKIKQSLFTWVDINNFLPTKKTAAIASLAFVGVAAAGLAVYGYKKYNMSETKDVSDLFPNPEPSPFDQLKEEPVVYTVENPLSPKSDTPIPFFDNADETTSILYFEPEPASFPPSKEKSLADEIAQEELGLAKEPKAPIEKDSTKPKTISDFFLSIFRAESNSPADDAIREERNN